MTFQIEPLPPEEPQSEKKSGCLMRAIAGVVILALLASSLAAVAWFVTRQAGIQSSPVQLSTQQVQEVPELDEALPTAEPALTPSSPTEMASPIPAEEAINRIVFVNDEGHIETISPNGSDRRLVSGEDYAFQYPAWSPDGEKIAALGSSSEGSGIFLMQDQEISGSVEEVLFGDGRTPFYLYWSPDSSKIGFLASRFGRGMSLNIVEAREGMESQQLASGSPFYWNWTADSQQLLIHSGALGEDARLALIDKIRGLEADEIESPGYFQAPGISPSGRFWAYSQLQDGGNSWLTVDDRETGEKLTQRHAGSVALSWSPVDDQLAFISGDSERQSSYWGPLRLLDAQTGDIRVLSSNLVLAFFWSPDGTKIVTISVPLINRLDEAIEVRGPNSRQLSKSLPVQQRPPHKFMISVINVMDGSGLELGEVSLPTSFLSQFLVFFDQYALSHSIWSPNSDAIVLPILLNNSSQLMVITTSSGRMNEIGSGQIAFWSPR
ncbi:MAG: hypothetical protein R3293_09930 [Candidatus Promineifilaceae bacterium]|nr:hypothetical protein [Candidatus Promineifilaceae bacterium]